MSFHAYLRIAAISRYGVSLSLDLELDLEILVSAPSSWDLDAHTSDVIGDPAGGGYILSSGLKRMRLPVDLVWCVETEKWDPEGVELREGLELIDEEYDADR